MARITLKPFNALDIDDHMDWATDEKTAQFCSWEVFSAKEEFLKYFNDRILTHPWIRAVCLNDKPIGYVLVTPNASDMDECRAEIGYGFGSRHWGKGLATKAVKMVVTEIFEERPKLRRIEAFVVVENVGSQKVLEKVGFCKEGVLREYFVMKGRIRDVALFSILSTDQVNSSANSQKKVAFFLITAATYEVWRARNKAIFESDRSSLDAVSEHIGRMLKMKLELIKNTKAGAVCYNYCNTLVAFR